MPLLQNHLAVHEYILNAHRILLWEIERGRVLDSLRIEKGKIGVIPLLN